MTGAGTHPARNTYTGSAAHVRHGKAAQSSPCKKKKEGNGSPSPGNNGFDCHVGVLSSRDHSSSRRARSSHARRICSRTGNSAKRRATTEGRQGSTVRRSQCCCASWRSQAWLRGLGRSGRSRPREIALEFEDHDAAAGRAVDLGGTHRHGTQRRSLVTVESGGRQQEASVHLQAWSPEAVRTLRKFRTSPRHVDVGTNSWWRPKPRWYAPSPRVS